MKIASHSSTRSMIALSIKVATILLVTFAIYYQDFSITVNYALQNEQASYILAIPLILIYLLYRKRKMLRAAIPLAATEAVEKPNILHEVVGALLCLSAYLLYWHGSYTFTPLEYHTVSLPIFVAGVVLVMFNVRTLKVLAFPIALLLLLTPPPIQTVSDIGAILSAFAATASSNALKALGLSVELISQYGTPVIVLSKPESQSIVFALESACSGIYSLMGFAIFAVFVAYISRVVLWKKGAIFLVGFPFIYALNIIRIMIVTLVGYEYGIEAAMQTFHLVGGWILILLGTLFLLYLSEKIWKVSIFPTSANSKKELCQNCNPKQKSNEAFCSECGRLLRYKNVNISRRDLVKIAAFSVSMVLILTLQVPSFALAGGSALVLVQSPESEQVVATQILPQIPDYNLQYLSQNRGFEAIASQDAALLYRYTPLNDSAEAVSVSLEIGSSAKVWHSWEWSILAPEGFGGSQATQLDLRDVQLVANPPIIGRFFAFKWIGSDEIQIVLYWYESAVFKVGATFEQKYVKISLVVLTSDAENVSSIEEKLLPFGLAVANYWQPIKTWSNVALLISKNGDKLVALTVASLLAIVLLDFLQSRRQRKTNNILYEKTSKVNKQIVDAVHRTELVGIPTLNNVRMTYRNITKRRVSKENLGQKLLDLEQMGIIKKDIFGRNDEPLQIWKTNIQFKAKTLFRQLSSMLRLT